MPTTSPTAPTTTAATATAAAFAAGRVFTTSPARALRAEWIKLRTLRSTWITAAATLLVIIGVGALAALMSSGELAPPGGAPAGGPGGAATGPLSTVLAGANPALLVVAVMGSIVGAREFATGMIRTSLAAVPSRLPVLGGKLLSFAAIMVPTVVAGVVAAFSLGMNLLNADHAATVAWGDPGVARAILGTAYYIVGLGLIGVALGTLLRNTAAAIATVLGAVLFLPALASALLPDSGDEVLKYLPSNAGSSFTTTIDTASSLSPTAGAVVFTTWIAVAIAAATGALLQRDA